MPARQLALAWKGLGFILRGLIVAFMVAPAIVVAVLSFSNSTILQFPPASWGLSAYESFFGSSYWLQAVLTSLRIGVISAGLALLVGVPAAYALHRTGLPFRGAIQLLALTPLMLPGVAYAVAMYTFFIQAHLVYTTTGVVLTDTVLGVPFVVLVCGTAITRIPAELEFVAMTLGATRVRAVWGITLRLLLPAILAAAIFAFLASFDEGVFIQFLGGPGQTTLPKAVFDSVRTGLNPLITAIATLLMAGTMVVSLIAFYWRSTALRGGEVAE